MLIRCETMKGINNCCEYKNNSNNQYHSPNMTEFNNKRLYRIQKYKNVNRIVFSCE